MSGLQTAPSVRGSRLASVAASQPPQEVTAEELGRPFGKDSKWVHDRTGIRTLHRFADRAELLTHAVLAARTALDESDGGASDVDLLIVASCSTNLAPGESLAARIADELGVTSPYVDLNSACAGFSYALAAADHQIRAGDATRVLIVAAEYMSGLLDEADLGTGIIFGDGVGAAVVVAHGEPHIGPAVQGSDGSQAHLITMDSEGRLRMLGREVFRWAVETVPAIAQLACERAGIATDEIDILVLHQANLRIIDAVVHRLRLNPDARIATDVVRSGNTSAASIPLALSRLRRDGHLNSGSLALLVGFGAGLAFSAQVIRAP